MLKVLRKTFVLLTIGETGRLYWLIAAVVVMGLLDMVGVASIFPFLSVVSNPDMIQKSSKLKLVYDRLGFTDQDTFLIALGAFAFLVLLFGNICRSATTMAMVRFGHQKRYIISRKLLSHYLYEPYVFFLNRNSAELVQYLLSEVGRLVTGVLIPCMQVFARSIAVILIIIVLFVVNPLVAVCVIGLVGGGYGVIYAFVRKRLSKVGKKHLTYSRQIVKALYEAFGGIKDIKLYGKEQVFIERYSRPARDVIDCYCWQFFVEVFPRYAFETISFGAILFITVYTVVIRKEHQLVVPLVGLYALAAYRFMPSLQQIYQDITNIRASLPSLEMVYRDFINCSGKFESKVKLPALPMLFAKTIELRAAAYQYPMAQKPVIEGLSLVIQANTTVGLVGGSGAGKTTVVDILLGLLRPREESLWVDGRVINDDNLHLWQANIGYVPQQIYLCDDTVTNNIAFGVPEEEIDHKAVQRAATLANIHDFIVHELPRGYETEVGERGIRLSGGQRQRIGIARALYHDPSLLVFDEATSALDGITEDIILEAIHQLAHTKTIIIIAHRISTVKECDVIYMLEKGRVAGEGTYAQLIQSSEQFRKMAKVDLAGQAPGH